MYCPNFYPFTFNYKGRRFRSSEHAYQHEKAIFLGDNELAKWVFYSPVFQNWEINKEDIMRDILWANQSNVIFFRSELLKTHRKIKNVETETLKDKYR